MGLTENHGEIMSLNLKAIVIGTLGLIISCSSNSTRPPEQSFIGKSITKIQNNKAYIKDLDLNRLEENERQATVYLQALNFQEANNNKAACDRFKYLGKDKSFPLAQLALIKSLNVCDYLKIKSLYLWKGSLSNVFPYFRKEFLENSIALAKTKGIDEYFARFSIEYTDYLETKSEKEKHLKKTIKSLAKLPQLKNLVREKLYDVSPRFIKKPKRSDVFPMAKDFLYARDFAKARKLLKAVFNDSKINPEERILAYKKYAFSFKLDRNKKKYSWKLEQLLKWIKSQKDWLKSPKISDLYWELKIDSSRAQWTVNYRSRAEKQLNEMVYNSNTPENIKAYSYWLLGKIEVEKKSFDNANTFYEKGLSLNFDDAETLERLTWSLGWNYFLDKKYHKAKDTFFLAEERTKEISFRRKLQFWQAKILLELKQKNEANSILEDLMEKDPYGYYGIAASMILNKPLLPPGKKSYVLKETPYPTLDWLVATSNFQSAEYFLKDLKITSADILPLYHFAKWYEGGIFKFFSFEPEEREELLEDHLPAAFPLPHQQEALGVAKKSQIPLPLIYSIARQESAFNPKVRSWADAFGLLQVTPRKAKSLSKRYSIPYRSFNDLYEVKKNLTFGALILKELANSNQGQFIRTIASYNAGPAPVKGWYKSYYSEDPFVFIERIPYEETSTYLKLVLRNYSTYTRLLGQTWSESLLFFDKKLF